MIKSFLNSFSMIGFHDYLKRNIGINLDICVKSHNVSKETMIFIRELPNSEYINVGLEEILEYIKTAMEKGCSMQGPESEDISELFVLK